MAFFISSLIIKKELEQTMGEHILAFGELIGMYKRQQS